MHWQSIVCEILILNAAKYAADDKIGLLKINIGFVSVCFEFVVAIGLILTISQSRAP